MYDAFFRKLPGFGPEHWTSELRGFVEGFQPYEGHSDADFTYPDTQGTLTALWFGKDSERAKWRPVYHIEVKSSSGDAVEPFHMSTSQLELVC